MWVVTNHGLLSIVSNRAKGFSGTFLVRARRKEDLYHFFGNKEAVEAVLIENPDADYQYRVMAESDTVKAAMFRQVDLINYWNYKDSIPKDDTELKRFACEVWSSGWRNLSQDDKSVQILKDLDREDAARKGPISQRTGR